MVVSLTQPVMARKHFKWSKSMPMLESFTTVLFWTWTCQSWEDLRLARQSAIFLIRSRYSFKTIFIKLKGTREIKKFTTQSILAKKTKIASYWIHSNWCCHSWLRCPASRRLWNCQNSLKSAGLINLCLLL